MSKNKIDQWNNRYAESSHLFGTEANAFMCSQQQRFKPGMTALAIGDGEAYNGIWLAQNNLNVYSVDSSLIAQEKARANANKAGVALNFVCADILKFFSNAKSFDLIVHFFVHLPANEKIQLHNEIINHLNPGGIYLLECFHIDQLNYNSGGPKDEHMLYSEAEILRDFASLKTVILEKVPSQVYQEQHGFQPGATVQYLGLKI